MIDMQNETISNYKTQGLNVFYIPQGRTFTTDDWDPVSYTHLTLPTTPYV